MGIASFFSFNYCNYRSPNLLYLLNISYTVTKTTRNVIDSTVLFFLVFCSIIYSTNILRALLVFNECAGYTEMSILYPVFIVWLELYKQIIILCWDKWNLGGTKHRGKRKEGEWLRRKVFKEEINYSVGYWDSEVCLEAEKYETSLQAQNSIASSSALLKYKNERGSEWDTKSESCCLYLMQYVMGRHRRNCKHRVDLIIFLF